jgi:hypothetical protein
MSRIQLITIIISVLFLGLVSRLVVKGRLREEYSIVWLLFTAILVAFSFWENGLRLFSDAFGVSIPANLVFTISIFVALVYLLHLSVVASKLQKQNKTMAQEMAMMRIELDEMKNDKEAGHIEIN